MNANLTKANPKATPFDLSLTPEAAISKTTSPDEDKLVPNLNLITTADAPVEGVDNRARHCQRF